jgi:putative transcriptional regulator
MTLSGRLLVASPRLLDPNFSRTVVLLLDHNDEGTFGVVLNRPLPVEVDAVLPGWQDVVSIPGGLFQGGPVGLDGAIGVAVTRDEEVPVVDRFTGAFGLVDLDADPVALVGRFTGLRIFAGHSGWASGQLEGEIEEGSWFVVPSEPGDAFTAEPDTLWSRVLLRQGGELAMLAHYPPDVHLN